MASRSATALPAVVSPRQLNASADQSAHNRNRRPIAQRSQSNSASGLGKNLPVSLKNPVHSLTV